MKTHTKEFLDNVTPQKAYEQLLEGNNRFVANLKVNRDHLQLLNEIADGQFPFAVVLSCMDSRTSAELIFDLGLGDIFSIRIAGNIVNQDIVESMEYACTVVKSKLIVVLGHSGCGAVKSACTAFEQGSATNGLLGKIQPAIDMAGIPGEQDNYKAFCESVASANVQNSIDEILEKSEVIRELYREGEIGIVGAMYSLDNGKVTFTQKLFTQRAEQNHLVF